MSIYPETWYRPHYHVARRSDQIERPEGYPDKCQLCGRDIRDEVHIAGKQKP